MFALHETTQRRVCRGIFLVGCLLPTLLTLGWIAYWHRPWREADWQRTLAQNLHMRAEVEQMTAPRPGTTALTNLRLADLRTAKTLGSMPKLTIQQRDSRLTLSTEHLELQAQQLPQLVAALATWLASELAADALTAIDFQADQLTISDASLQTIRLKNLSVASDFSDPAIQRFRFRAESIFDAGKTIQLVLENQGDTLRVKLNTQQTWLPAWLIGKLVPGVGGCGPAKFSGVVTAENKGQQTRGELRGRLEEVDLQQWAGTASPHRLECLAQVQLEHLAWSDDIVEVARGEMKAGASQANYSLFLALADPKIFHCGIGPGWKNHQPTSAEEPIGFEQLALRFEMTSAGIRLTGGCEGGALMLAEAGPLLYGPPKDAVLPVASLVQLFHRPQKGWLPDTRGAHKMASGLPLPGETEQATKNIRK